MADLDTIEAACEAATKGEWVAQDCFRGDVRVLTGTVVADRHPSDEWPVVFRAPTEHLDPQAGCNARFIALARSAVPELIAEVRRLRAALDGLGDYESFARTFMGGYWSDPELSAFQHGMSTVCNAAKGARKGFTP